MDTLEKNKLIEEFLGKDKSIVLTSYDKDWNAILPVLPKINKIRDESFLDVLDIASTRMNAAILHNDIKEAHSGMIEFIQAYNKNK